MLKEFTIAKIGELNGGRVAAQIDLAIQDCIRDMGNRPGCNEARTVKIDCKIKPIIDQDGVCTHFDLEFNSSRKLPNHKSASFTMKINPGKNTGSWNDESMDNPNQHTLDEAVNNGTGEFGE